MTALRYEVSILIGPCSQDDAERAMQAAHEAVAGILSDAAAPGTALNLWDEESENPGAPVDDVDVLG